MAPPRTDYRCPTSTRSRPSRSTSSVRWRPSSSGRCCCSPAARTRSSCCALAEKAFWPAPDPVPGDARRHRAQLPRGARVPRPAGRASWASGWSSPRCRTPSTRAGWPRRPAAGPAATGCRPPTLLDAIEEHGFDAVFGGARRDEEKARAKERVFSFRDEFGQWDPKNQRPELWSLYNGRHRKGEHIRVFPLSNWTELDIWQYIAERGASSCRRSTSRTSARCSGATACCSPISEFMHRAARTRTFDDATVRYRTVGDMTCTGAVESTRGHGRRGHRRGRRHPDHRARRDPGRRPVHRGRDGRPQARGVLLDGTAALRHGRLASTTARAR